MPQQRTISKDPRTAEQIAEHYALEKRLAERLRNSTRAERAGLYNSVYEELFQRVVHHPQLREKSDDAARRAAVANHAELLRRFLSPGDNYLEIGAGDCLLAMEVARFAGRVYAIEVSETIAEQTMLPANMKLVITDGVSLGVPDGTINVAYSDQLMEHIHPEDALPQLKNVYRVLAPRGVYICSTPNRLSGPHDISKHFDAVATGFHLREYTITELQGLFREAGFRRTYVLRRLGERWVRLARAPVYVLEAIVGRLPRSARIRLARAIRPGILVNYVLIGEK